MTEPGLLTGKEEEPKQSLGYVSASAEEIADTLFQLTLADERNGEEPTTMEPNTILKLGDNNYYRWKRELELTLEVQGILEVTTGEEVYPVRGTLEQQRMWKRKDRQATLTILRTLPDEVFAQVQSSSTSVELLKSIVDLKEPHSENITQSLKVEFFNLSWGTYDTASLFWSKIMTLATKIQTNGEDVKKDIIPKVLASLPPKFTFFKSHWNFHGREGATPEEFKRKLLEAERDLTEESTHVKTKEEVTAMVTTKEPEQEERQAEVLITTKDEEPCTWTCKCRDCVNQRLARSRRNTFQGKCFHCQKRGHRASECWTKKDLNKNTSTYSCVSSSITENQVILDSGATDHMTSEERWFQRLRRLDTKVPITIADGSRIYATGIGDIQLQVKTNQGWKDFLWTNVYLVPKLGSTSLMSCAQLVKDGFSINMQLKNEKPLLTITKQNMVIAIAMERGHCELQSKLREKTALTIKTRIDTETWHRRLGHISDQTLKTIIKNKLVTGVTGTFQPRRSCQGCHLGKQTANRHKSKETKRNVKPGEAMHSDLCDSGERAWDGNRYLMVLKCEASGYSMPYFLKDKSGVYEALNMAIERIKRETGNSMKYFRSDNGTEYVNEKVKRLFLEKNIEHERSPPDVKQANGIAERENRTLMDGARTLLYDIDLDKGTQRRLWSEAVATTAYLRNRVPHKGKTEVTPYELWFGNKPDGRPLRTFGSTAFTRIPDHLRRKMDP
jgi:hypothetical protein